MFALRAAGAQITATTELWGKQAEGSHLDLGLLFPHGRFIDGHLNGLLIVRHHYGPQCAVLRVDLLVIY